MKKRHWLVLSIMASLEVILVVLLWAFLLKPDQPAAQPAGSLPSTLAAGEADTEGLQPLVSPTAFQTDPAALETEIQTFPNPLTEEPPLTTLEAPLVSESCVITATGGLGSEIYSIMQAMPGPDSDGMRLPALEQMAAWESLITAVKGGNVAGACAIIQANQFPYHLVNFIDLPNNNEAYWILKEDSPVLYGWGTYVIRPGGGKLVVEVPHPVADWRTDPEGVEIFRKTGALALLVAGANRCSNKAYSACGVTTWACGPLEPYRESDVAGEPGTIFQATHQSLSSCGNGTTTLQLHANDLAGCPDLFISNGTTSPGPLAERLYRNAVKYCSGFSVDLANGGAGECAFNGGLNVQGLFSNSCGQASGAALCSLYFPHAPSPEPFLFVEQSVALTTKYSCLNDAVQATFSTEP